MKRCHFVKRLAFAAAALLLAVAAAPIVRADEIDDAVAMFTADDGLTAADADEAQRRAARPHRGDDHARATL